MSEEMLLTEIRRLNRVKGERLDEIKALEKSIGALKIQKISAESEINAFEEKLKPLRKKQTDLELAIRQAQQRVDEVSQSADSKIDECDKKIKLLVEQENKLKAAQVELDSKKDDAKGMVSLIEQRKAALNLQEDEAKKALISLNKSREQFNKDIEKNALALKEIAEKEQALKEKEQNFSDEKAKLVEDWRKINSRAIALDKKEAEIQAEISKAKTLEADILKSNQAQEKKAKDLEAKFLSVEKEKIEIQNQRKLLERDTLRFEKLVKENNLEKELAELRKG